ncbi:putative anion transporter 5 [Micractinium conductrix]|uniref:Anion transporter 5 n=1 Tax=Micractinium conductrix TaxID=554055 RepID=A0A2P6VMH7_9CHLO|nr:putative anion transporter 5 [Micractinium conductrix]|eukprot:PSC75289.1 putative anion transporter 5 [Micractinium conductrix]
MSPRRGRAVLAAALLLVACGARAVAAAADPAREIFFAVAKDNCTSTCQAVGMEPVAASPTGPALCSFRGPDTGTQVAQQNGTVACRVVDVVRKAIRTYSAADGYRCGCLPRQQGKPAGNPNVAWAPRDKACPAGYVPSYFGRCRAVNAVGKPAVGEPIVLRSRINGTWFTENACVWGQRINATTGAGTDLYTKQHDRLCVPSTFTFSSGAVTQNGGPRELWLPVTARRCPTVCAAVGLAAVQTPSGGSLCWLGLGFPELLVGMQPQGQPVCMFPRYEAAAMQYIPGKASSYLCACIPPQLAAWRATSVACPTGYASSPFPACRADAAAGKSYIGYATQRYSYDDNNQLKVELVCSYNSGGGGGNGMFSSAAQQQLDARPQLGADVGRAARRRRPWLEPRFHIVLACFLATFTAYVERVGFSIAFTAMAGEANVDEGVKGTVLSAFYWGYALSQVPGGWAAQRWGGERMLTFSFAAWSLAVLATPGSAASIHAVVAARVSVGLAQGFLIPAVHTVLAAWIPPTERARAVSLTTSGMYLGSAAAMLALPGLAASLGPAALLRFTGGLGLAWLALWRLTLARVRRAAAVAAMPTHGGADGLAATGDAAGKGLSKKGRPVSTPWRAMLLHPAVWAIIFNNYTFHYAFYVVMNWAPTYFDKVLHASLASLGAVKTLPYLLMFAASNAGGWAGDYIINVRRRSVAAGRKLVNTAGFWSAAVALMLMPGARSVGAGVLWTTLTLACAGFSRGGFSVNHMDIAPKYAGVVMGISNTAGTLAGVVGVAATGYMLQWAGGADHAAGWYQAFAAAAAQCLAGSLVFAAAARGDRLFGGDATSEYS